MSIEVGLDVGVQLEGLRQEIRHDRRRSDERAKAMEPVDVRFQQSATSAATGDLGLGFSGPDAGYYWFVRRIVVGGASWSSTVSGTAEVYVTGINQVSGMSGGYVTIRDLADQADQAATLPNRAFYGIHELPVQSGENLVIVIRVPSATTLYKASIQVQQFRTLATPTEISA